LASNGDWFTITLNSPINFSSGETFYIEIGSFSFIEQPIGGDLDALIPNKSYLGDGFTYYNLNSISGAENGALIIRAIGTAGGGGTNQDPVAVANVSKSQAEINESISFDASQSYDNDGNIIQYLWDFGDGNTSNQQSASHAYIQATSFTYTLTVTDNEGATGQTSGQIQVSDPTNPYVTVEPKNGIISPGGSQTILLTLNAQNLSEGTYIGEIKITTDGGNITIPIDYLVDVQRLPEIPNSFNLSQNYPNPFNPSTSIEFSVPKTTKVSLKIYDLLGKELAVLLNERKSPGNYRATFNASNLASGIYIYRLETDEFKDTKKLMFIK